MPTRFLRIKNSIRKFMSIQYLSMFLAGINNYKSRFVLSLFGIVTFFDSPVYAIERRISMGDLHWTSAALQGAAGMGAFSESWVDQAQTDVSLLARRKQRVEIDLLSPTALVSRDAVTSVIDTIKAFSSDSGSSSSSSAQTTAAALDKVRAVFGKSMTAQENLSVLGIRIGRVGIAPYQTGIFDATIDNSSWPKFDAYLGGYAGVLLSYSQSIGKDFDFGFALRPGVGGYRSYELDLSLLGDVMTDSSSTSGQSQGTSFDFPTAVYLPIDLAAGWWVDSSTRFHLASRNTFDSAPLSVLSGNALKMQSLINAGLVRQISLSGSKNQSFYLGTEVHDLAGLRAGWNELLLRTQWAGKYAVKLPFRDQTTFAINLGLRSGYPVASVFLDMFLAKFEFALSTREMGGYPGQRPSRLMTFTTRTQMQF